MVAECSKWLQRKLERERREGLQHRLRLYVIGHLQVKIYGSATENTVKFVVVVVLCFAIYNFFVLGFTGVHMSLT